MPAALDMAFVAGPTLAAMFDKLYNSCMDGQTSSSVYSLHGFVDEQREIADDSETKLVRRLVLTEFRSDITSAASATHETVVGRLVVRRNTVHQLSYLDSEFLRSRPTTTTATTSVLLLLTSAMSESGSEKMEYTLFAGGAQSTNPTVVRLAVTNINDSSQRVTTLVNSFALTSARFGSPYAGAGATPSSTRSNNAAAGLNALSSLSTLSNNVSDLLKTETTLRQEVANLTELLWLTRQRRHQEEHEARRQQKEDEMAKRTAMENDSPQPLTTEEEEGGAPPRVLAAAEAEEAESSSKSLSPTAAAQNPSPVNHQEREAAGGDHDHDDGGAVQDSSANATAADIEAPIGDEDMSSWQHVGAVSETEDPPAVPSAPPHDDSDWVCADPLAATAAGPDDASVSES